MRIACFPDCSLIQTFDKTAGDADASVAAVDVWKESQSHQLRLAIQLYPVQSSHSAFSR